MVLYHDQFGVNVLLSLHDLPLISRLSHQPLATPASAGAGNMYKERSQVLHCASALTRQLQQRHPMLTWSRTGKDNLFYKRIFSPSVIVFLFAFLFRRLCELFFPKFVGGGLVDVCEDEVVNVRVPVDGLAFNAFFDVLYDGQYSGRI